MKLRWGRIISCLIVLAVIAFGVYILLTKEDKKLDEPKEEPNVPTVPEEPKKLQIVDEESKSRPFAIMINNHHAAWPQSGLQNAYLVYEIVAEGGITRMLALFKDAPDNVSIGSIRSSRHYYLDYALENDAVYVHYGWSERAKEEIDELNVANINGMQTSGFWRDTTLDRAYEHTVFTNLKNMAKAASNYGYRKETNKDLLLNYSVDEIDLSKMDGAIKASNIEVVYSYYHTSSYKYDSENKVYKRFMSGVANKDLVTGKQYTVKNIITYKIKNYSFDDEGRQDLKNLGKGEGYYITNGYAVPITWEKDTRTSQTVYRYLDGTEITVNDGNTYIQIQPINQTLTIK